VGGLVTWDIEDVQNTSCCGLGGGRLGRVMGYVVAIDDVVVPVSLSGLECGALEPEFAFPRTRLGGSLILREGKLASVVVPGTEEVDGLDAGGGSQRERELNGCHFVDLKRMHLSDGINCSLFEQEELVYGDEADYVVCLFFCSEIN